MTNHPARKERTAKWQQSDENCPNGNHSLEGISVPYKVQGMDNVATGIALLERSAHAARELGPFSDKLDGFLGQLGLIALKMMTKPLPDCSDDLAMLARIVRE